VLVRTGIAKCNVSPRVDSERRFTIEKRRDVEILCDLLEMDADGVNRDMTKTTIPTTKNFEVVNESQIVLCIYKTHDGGTIYRISNRNIFED
jgi:hypothetical protein